MDLLEYSQVGAFAYDQSVLAVDSTLFFFF